MLTRTSGEKTMKSGLGLCYTPHNNWPLHYDGSTLENWIHSEFCDLLGAQFLMVQKKIHGFLKNLQFFSFHYQLLVHPEIKIRHCKACVCALKEVLCGFLYFCKPIKPFDPLKKSKRNLYLYLSPIGWAFFQSSFG